jgi:signal peptidase II
MQAARGTSLSPDDSSLSTTDPRSSSTRFRVLLVGVAGLLYAADQTTKALAVDRLSGEPDKQVIGDLLQLHLTRNSGAAFSTGTAYTEVLSCLAIVAALVVLWLGRRVGSTAWAVALGLLLAGIAGNLTDRLVRDPGPLRGQVIDFLMLPHWPVFNVADMCINVAAAMILVQAFRGIRIDGSRHRDGREPGVGREVAGP